MYCTVKVSIRKYTWTKSKYIDPQIDHFFIMVIYTRFPYVLYFRVQLRYQYETTPALQDQVYILKFFLSWLYILDFRIFCISMYSEGINTKLHQHYMTKSSYMLKLIINFFIMVIYSGFPYVLYFHVQ